MKTATLHGAHHDTFPQSLSGFTRCHGCLEDCFCGGRGIAAAPKNVSARCSSGFRVLRTAAFAQKAPCPLYAVSEIPSATSINTTTTRACVR